MTKLSSYIIPTNPNLVLNSRYAALVYDMLVFGLNCTIYYEVNQKPKFYGSVESFKYILCPKCRTELSILTWHEWMDAAYTNRFTRLDVITPCCQATVSLNDLVYGRPAGFARCAFNIYNAGAEVDLQTVIKFNQDTESPFRYILS